MKILLFNLGPIEHRIIGWDIQGFKSLLNQDVILWGPIPNDEFIYANRQIPILRIYEPIPVKDLFEMLPDGWFPDIVTCETSVLNYIPDIYLCPVKTILFTRDAWSDTIFNKKLVELFDFLNHAVIDRSEYKTLNVSLLPLSNCAVSLPGPDVVNSGFKDREIDVVAIANCDSSFYHERYRTFYKLAAANKSGIKFYFLRGVKRADISSYYQRSKIMMDWAHTLSNRSYEAALNGCLLFSHTNNLLIKEFWVPWEEYIPYDDDNVLELITFYLNNPEKAQKVIDRSKEKGKTKAFGWGDYVWENINSTYNTKVSIEERIKYIESIPLTVLHHCSATSLLYNYEYETNFPTDWQDLYFKRIDKALSYAGDQTVKIAPLIEAARFSFLLKQTGLSIIYLDKLQEILPDYAWIYYLHGRIWFSQGEYTNALNSAQKAVACALNNPELLQTYVLPVIEKGNTCDGRRITNYMWQPIYNHKNEFQSESLLYLALELSGYIYEITGEPLKALNSYTDAIAYIPIPDSIYKANDLLIQSKDFEKLLLITGKGVENSPYDSLLIFYKAYALIQLRQNEYAFKILKEHRNALKCFLGVRKIVIIRNVINLILLLMMFGKQPNSKIIIEMIRRLKKKMRKTYLKS
jgi:tetratricopeptide (TPR) repeat protein